MTDNLSKERDPERRLRIPWSRGVHTLNECLPSTICTVIGCHHIVLFIFKKKKKKACRQTLYSNFNELGNGY